MCGIFAYFSRENISPEQLALIRRAFEKIKHRGPDSTNEIFIKPNAFIGFQRLAIIDLSARTHTVLNDKGVYLTCNGEIYNYKFLIEKFKLDVKTGSDCEVILQMYIKYPAMRATFLKELDGVFAFVLYDSTQNRVMVGRDRWGVRPVFMAIGANELCFASEGKAIPMKNARQFPPGVMLTINLNDFSLDYEKWFVNRGMQLNMSVECAMDVIKVLFIEAVRKRLMSDRPIGFLVSGGLDSSLVASVASFLMGKKITTFSIGLPGSRDLVASKKVAEYLNSDHHEIIISTDDIISALNKVIYHAESYDITTIRASIPMYLLSKYIRENTNIKVIFSGEGSDELFGGYLYFHRAPSSEDLQTETRRLMDELYMYDLLRGDRMTAAWGLEFREPFLDASLTTFVSQLDPVYKMPNWHPKSIEKGLLREAFRGYLPDEILFRQKDAFSDSIGSGSVTRLKEYALEQDGLTAEYNYKSVGAFPHTAEARLYYRLFQSHFKENEGMYTQKYWMPRWYDNVFDPSATVLDVYVRGERT